MPDAPPTRQADLFTRSGAAISDCGLYRLRLWRLWGDPDCLVNWIMLNPSTADATQDDPTIRRCVGFARAWGYGGIVVTNLFALRATDPKEIRRAEDPIGAGNDLELIATGKASAIVVAAWGNHGAYLGRAHQVCQLLEPDGVALHALATTQTGQPAHPLYQRGDLKPTPYAHQQTKATKP